MASIAGWIYETVLEVFVWKTGFSNRGFLYGPYLPVYGFGVLAFFPGFLWISKQSIHKVWKIVLVAIFCALVATVIELGTSYLMEALTGGWFWNYAERYKYQFDGRIALDTSLRFGVGGMGLTYLISFIGDKAVSFFPKLKVLFLMIAGAILLDFCYTVFVR